MSSALVRQVLQVTTVQLILMTAFLIHVRMVAYAEMKRMVLSVSALMGFLEKNVKVKFG